MTASLVAVVTDVMRDGRRVVGYGFNSNGRYGQGGLIRERFRNRILEAEPEQPARRRRRQSRSARIWAAMMSNEKPGGHGERSVAVGTLDMAVWDAVAKIAGKPLFRLLAERKGREAESARLRLCGGRLLLSGQGQFGAARGNARLSQPRLQRREDEDRRRARSTRIAAGSRRCWRRSVRRRSSPSMPTAVSISRPASPTPRCCATIRCSGTRKSAIPLDYALQAAISEFYPGPDGDRRESVLAPGCAQSAALRRHAAGSRLAAVRLRAVLRAGRISAHARCAGAARLVAVALRSPWRPPDVAEHRRRSRARRQ